MKALIVLTVCLGAALAGVMQPNQEHDSLWQAYKTKFNKSYKLQFEEAMRKAVWLANMEYVAKHNREYDLGQHTYTLGINEYADMPHEEFKRVMLPKLFNITAKQGSTFLPPSSMADLATTVDWRKKGYVTPVKNQGQCGSCWSFSATGSLEGQHFKKTGQLVSLSEQQLVDCSGSFGNNGCQGGLMDNAFKYIKSVGGIESEQEYPYTARNGRCHFIKSDVKATDTGFVDIPHRSEADLQKASATVGPISVAIDASHMSFQLYKSGVYDPFLCSETALDHGVLVVGYGTYMTKDYWLVKNSWGSSWGQDGYIWMARNRNNKCGIASQASYPLV